MTTPSKNSHEKWDASAGQDDFLQIAKNGGPVLGGIGPSGVPYGTLATSGSGSSAFDAITGGINTSAAMVIGSGASLSASGSGTIAATSVPASGIGAGTNNNALVIGTGGSVSTSGSGMIAATSTPFSGVSAGTNTGALTIGTGGLLQTSGSGQILASNGITLVSSIPATCTPGSTPMIQLTTTPFGLYTCTGTNVWSRSSAPNNVIDPTAFGAKFDGKVFYGNNSSIVITSGSPTVTCNNCNFTAADVGKQFTASSGGVGGVAASYQGVFAIPNSPTTILAVNSATSITISRNATVSCTTGCEIAYATNDDAALDAAEAAWQALPVCGTIVLPAGTTAVLKGHFNNPGTACLNQTTSIDYNALIYGQGQGSTQIGLFAGFDSTTCTGGGGDVCFFGYNQAVVNNLAFNGFGAGNTGFGSAKKLLGPGLGSQISDVACNAFGGSDANLIGFSFNGLGVRAKFLSIDGCGKVGAAVNSGICKCFYCFFGDTLGPNLSISNSAEFNDYGSDYGLSGGTIVIDNAGIYRGFGTNLFGCGATNSTAIYMGNAGAGGRTYLNNSKFNCASTTSNGVFMNNAGQKLYLTGGTIIGGTTAAISRSAGTVFTSPDTVFANGSITSLAPACTFSTGGGTSPSCALQAGSTNEEGVIIATTGTGSPGSTGTLTLTFAGTYAGPSNAAPSCTYTLDDSGTAWGDGAIVKALTQSTTAPTIAWSNYANSSGVATLATLATSSPFRIGYNCTAR